jgi:enterobactin synthetase component F
MSAVREAVSSTTALPLTAPQYGMWAAQQLDPASSAFWTAEAVELEGPLDLDALRTAVETALAACDALHMRYWRLDGDVVQSPRPSRAVQLPVIDLHGHADPARVAWDAMHADLRAPVDLDLHPLYATSLFRLDEQRHLWHLRSHHIALDGFGYLLLIHRVAEAYSALRRGQPVPPGRDWSLQPLLAEERAYRASAACAKDRAFWAGQLQHAPPPARLSSGEPDDGAPLSSRRRLPAGDYPRWQAAARACGVDWAAWLVACIAAWMHARGGHAEVTPGLLVMNRLGSVALGVPCMAMNVVPLRLRVDANRSFRDLATQVAATMLAIRPHQRYNYEWMRIDHGLDGTHRQFYGPVVNLLPFDRGFVFEGLRSQAHPVAVGPADDLDLTISPLAAGLRFDIEANAGLYDEATLLAHHDALIALVASAARSPERSVAALAAEVAT